VIVAFIYLFILHVSPGRNKAKYQRGVADIEIRKKRVKGMLREIIIIMRRHF